MDIQAIWTDVLKLGLPSERSKIRFLVKPLSWIIYFNKPKEIDKFRPNYEIGNICKNII